MQNLTDFFSADELEAHKQALISGDTDTANSVFSAAIERYNSAYQEKEVNPLKSELQAIQNASTEAEKALHAKFMAQTRREAAKLSGLKEKDLEKLSTGELLAKAIDGAMQLKGLSVEEQGAKVQELVAKLEEYEGKLVSVQSEKETLRTQIEQEYTQKQVLNNFFASNRGLLQEGITDVIAFDSVTRELEAKGFFLKVENGEVVVKNAVGNPIYGAANKILSAKDVLSQSSTLKAFQKPISAPLPTVIEQKDTQSESITNVTNYFQKRMQEPN